MGIAHLAFELGLRDEGGHGVYDHRIDGVAPDEHLRDLQGLLAARGLRDHQLVHVEAELRGVARVQRVLRVDERDLASEPLGVGQHVQGESGLAGGLRAVDLGDPAPRDAAYPQRRVEGEGAGGDDLGLDYGVLAQPHDGALAELLLYLQERRLQCLLFLVGQRVARHQPPPSPRASPRLSRTS